ncbi:NAD(P)-dependent oxidoreductase [Nocardia alni]|uniref:NAD(P)-dependent oxidoreductase n=1 Tax=Nocardia alni TaxID=2815723 RepID=UPI001C23BABD|nr:NAD(P)-dependent oxidoreductase [Nocardia alni]
MNTAFLGLGRMGLPMAGRVLDAGHDLTVWNRSPERTKDLVAQGARVARTPAAAARDAEVVITMLADPEALEAVVFGPDGVAAGLRSDAVLVDMSTVGPEAVLSLHDRLGDTEFVDAPVMGSVGPARNGTLTVLAGGAVERVETLLGTFGTVVRCGAVGSGAARKVVLITAALAGMTLLGEVVALGEALGIDRDTVLDGLATGPLGGVVARARNADSDFAIDLAAKDVGLALTSADLPQLTAAHAWLTAAADAGDGQLDLRNVLAHIQTD